MKTKTKKTRKNCIIDENDTAVSASDMYNVSLFFCEEFLFIFHIK